MKLFCFGYGYCASYFAKSQEWEWVYGTHRNSFPLNDEALSKLAEATHILHSIPPTGEGDFVFNQNYKMNPKWFGYLSTTGVYGDHKGEWVDETTTVAPTNARSEWRANAEREWLSSGLPVNVFRLSGIYGAGEGRNAIEELKHGTAKRIYKENQFFSRIHVEDITQILVKSLGVSGEVFNCADDYPCSSAEVVEYAAKLMGVEPPPLVKFEDANLSEMARSFYSNSRKVSNQKIKEMLGVELKYPTYREGLAAIISL